MEDLLSILVSFLFLFDDLLVVWQIQTLDCMHELSLVLKDEHIKIDLPITINNIMPIVLRAGQQGSRRS